MYLHVPLQNNPEQFSELYLLDVAERTKWKKGCAKRHETDILTLENVVFITEIVDVKALLDNSSAYGVVGYLENYRRQAKNFFLVLFPRTIDSVVGDRVMFLRRHPSCTRTISSKFNGKNRMGFDELNANIAIGGETYMFHAAANSMEIFGHEKGSKELAIGKYNETITGINHEKLISGKNKRRLDSRQRLEKRHLSSVSLRNTAANRFIEKFNDNFQLASMPGHFGIRSKDSGGTVRVLPVTGNSDSEEELPPPLSEYHTIQEIDNVFCGLHNLSTIAHAVEVLEVRLNEESLNKDLTKELIIGAVASKFFEDISFQTVCEEERAHVFKSIKVDIDQVAVTISQLELKPFTLPETLSSTMSVLYATFREKVLLGRVDLSYGIVRMTYQKFASSVHQGGNTYMSRQQRRSYISIYNEGAMVSVLRVSVKYHDNKSRDEHIQATWDGMLYVANWLETSGPNVSAQKSTIWALDGNASGYEHNICSGPLFAYLTCAYLASVSTGGVTIASETFGTKELASVSVNLSPENNIISDSEAERVLSQLEYLLEFSAPFIIARTSQFFQEISKAGQLSKKPIGEDGFTLTWGIGCTVETELKQNLVYPSQPHDTVVGELARNSNDLGLPSYFASPKWNCSPTRKEAPAYTVIQVELPPYAAFKHSPSAWFVDPPGAASVLTSPHVLNGPGGDMVTDDDFSDDEIYNSVDNSETVRQQNNRQQRGKELHRNIAVASKSHVTYPGLGGILPFEMQPITINLKPGQKNLQFEGMISQCCTRLMHYTICGRMASGETGKQCTKKSHEMGYVELDIRLSADGGVFNMAKCLERKDNFLCSANATLNFLKSNGTAGRIEMAFMSTSSESSRSALLTGVKDTIALCLRNTKSYDPDSIVKVTRFALLGVLAKLEIAARMMNCKHPTGAVYEEIINVRLEVAALLLSFWSGKGKLRQASLMAPKNAYMACRPVFHRLRKYCEQSRDDILKSASVDFFEVFENALVLVDGGRHSRIESKDFSPTLNNYTGFSHMLTKVSGQACDRCFKIFTSDATLRSFDTHSCKAPDNGKCNSKGDLISMESKKFKRFYLNLCDKLDSNQRSMLVLLQGAREKKRQLLLFVTGYAGTGKSMSLTCAIIQEIVAGGMRTVEVVAPTKVGANVVDGKTLHALLKLTPTGFQSPNPNLNEDERRRAIKKQAKEHGEVLHRIDMQRAVEFKLQLQTLFVDECGMVSHDMFMFLDYFFRAIRGKLKIPFGGINIILCGDVLQLPPIIENDNNFNNVNNGKRQKCYFFESTSFLSPGFRVLYLQRNYRQSSDKDGKFIAVLNHMRDGQCTDDDCKFLNTECGHSVNRNSTDKVLKALIDNFNDEMITFRDGYLQSAHSTPSYLGKTKFEKLLYKLDHCWNKNILPTHVSHCFEGKDKDCVYKQTGSELFFHSKLFKDYENQVSKLTYIEDAEDDFVICNENVEISAISIAYQHGKVCVTIPAIDIAVKASIAYTSEPETITVTPHMATYASEELKLNSILKLRVGQKVFITMNGLDQFIANNSLVEIVKFVTLNACIEEIHVKPVLANTTLQPHVTILKRLSRDVSYKCASIEALITRSQFPVKPADGGSLFTAQGITLNQPYIINMQRQSHTGFGRAYVAYSRAACPTLALSLHPIRAEDVVVDPMALGFDLIHRHGNVDHDGLTHVNYQWSKLEDRMRMCVLDANARKREAFARRASSN